MIKEVHIYGSCHDHYKGISGYSGIVMKMVFSDMFKRVMSVSDEN